MLATVGLEFTGLYPPRSIRDGASKLRKPFPASDILQAVAYVAVLVYVYAQSVDRGDVLTAQVHVRLRVAVTRLQHAVEVANG